jgi:hypothetical protein
MFKIFQMIIMIAIWSHTHESFASNSTDGGDTDTVEVRITMPSATNCMPLEGQGTEQVLHLPETVTTPKSTYIRNCVPFVLSGTGAIIELYFVGSHTTNNNALLAADVLWFTGMVFGIINNCLYMCGI